MLKYKLLALDIDDTLTKSPDSVPEENLRAIRRAQAAGIYVTIATGRGYLGATPIWRKLGIAGPVITFGGALIKDTRSGETIRMERVEPELVRDVLETARGLGIHAQIYQGDHVLFEKNCAYGERYCFRQKLPYRVIGAMRDMEWTDITKILYITEPGQAAALIPSLTERYAGRLKVSGSKAGYIEFSRLGVDKGTGLARLAEMLDIPLSAAAAVGDNTLDLEMIQAAGLGAAVGDAQPCVQAACDLLLPNCMDFGVAWLIDNILLKEEA